MAGSAQNAAHQSEDQAGSDTDDRPHRQCAIPPPSTEFHCGQSHRGGDPHQQNHRTGEHDRPFRCPAQYPRLAFDFAGEECRLLSTRH